MEKGDLFCYCWPSLDNIWYFWPRSMIIHIPRINLASTKISGSSLLGFKLQFSFYPFSWITWISGNPRSPRKKRFRLIFRGGCRFLLTHWSLFWFTRIWTAFQLNLYFWPLHIKVHTKKIHFPSMKNSGGPFFGLQIEFNLV